MIYLVSNSLSLFCCEVKPFTRECIDRMAMWFTDINSFMLHFMVSLPVCLLCLEMFDGMGGMFLVHFVREAIFFYINVQLCT